MSWELLVIFQALGTTLFGVGIGLAGALMATRLIASRLFGVTALEIVLRQTRLFANT